MAVSVHFLGVLICRKRALLFGGLYLGLPISGHQQIAYTWTLKGCHVLTLGSKCGL